MMTLATHSISFFVPNFMRSDLGEADEAQVVVGVQHARRRVRTNLEKGFHRSPVDFASDVRLTFTNALAYNSKGQDVYKMAEKFLSQFDVWFDSLKPLPTLPLPRVPSPPPSPPPQPVVSKVETPPPHFPTG
ncbi:unnamed protein product [Brassica rapa subsp. narinosa]